MIAGKAYYGEYFDEDTAIAELLQDNVLHTNSFWFKDTWPEEAKQMTGLFVCCNDVFAWACADSLDITYKEIEELYRYVLLDPKGGSTIWCIIKARMLPQKPLYDIIEKEDIWDLKQIKEHYKDTWIERKDYTV